MSDQTIPITFYVIRHRVEEFLQSQKAKQIVWNTPNDFTSTYIYVRWQTSFTTLLTYTTIGIIIIYDDKVQ